MVIKTIPQFVDRIVVVNDCSMDQTAKIVRLYIEKEGKRLLRKNKKQRSGTKSKYEKAELILKTSNEEEIKFFLPSEVVNKDPGEDRVILINHLKNGGVGAAVARGYKWCKENDIDCSAVMAGDGQMDPRYPDQYSQANHK